MSWIAIIVPLIFSIVVQFLLWFNLLFPYNTLFENFNRSLYLAFSLSGLFGACISAVLFKIIELEEEKKIFVIFSIVFDIFCILSCLYFFISSLTGWLVF